MYSAASRDKTSAMRTLAQCYLDGSHGLNFNLNRAKYWLNQIIKKCKHASDREEAEGLLEAIDKAEYEYLHREDLDDFNWGSYINYD